MNFSKSLSVVTRNLGKQEWQGLFTPCGCVCHNRHARRSPRLGRRDASTMSAWQIHRYGGTDELTLSRTTRVPPVKLPDDVLVKIHAASVNPIDVLMTGGYGSKAINALRTANNKGKYTSEFPLILGRDFSGVVVETGKSVSRYKPGDEVWGVSFVTQPGTMAEYTVVSASHISKKPVKMSHIEAASLPYAALTAWSAVNTVGGLSDKNAAGKRVAMLGSSGGVGTFALQLLKSWDAEVTATCATDAVGMVISLGADVVLDYKKDDIKEELLKRKGFDMILDTIGGGQFAEHAGPILKKHANAKYVTIANHLLRYTDQSGLVIGSLRSVAELGPRVLQSLAYGQFYRWAVFVPNGRALASISKLVDEEKVSAVVEKVYPFEDVPKAFDKVGAKHNRGKTVIDVAGTHVEENKTESESVAAKDVYDNL